MSGAALLVEIIELLGNSVKLCISRFSSFMGTTVLDQC